MNVIVAIAMVALAMPALARLDRGKFAKLNNIVFFPFINLA